jgi:transcriptional regulator GlxA family with amidase domain
MVAIARLALKESSDPRIAKLVRIIQAEWDAKITLQLLAERLNLSVPYLRRLFKTQTKMSLREYVELMRLHYAARLLIHAELRVSEVSNYAGFRAHSDFDRAFLRAHGLPPSDFRDMARARLSAG